MKNNLQWLSLSCSFIALALVVWFFFKGDRVVYVDSTKLVNGYRGMEQARKEYAKKTSAWKANIDTLVKEVQGELVKFERGSSRMTPKEKDLTKKLIQTKQQQLAEYQQAIKEKAAQEDGEMTKKVLGEINTYLKEYGKEHRYRIILAATDYGNIAYAEDALDITSSVLDGLNKKFSGN